MPAAAAQRLGKALSGDGDLASAISDLASFVPGIGDILDAIGQFASWALSYIGYRLQWAAAQAISQGAYPIVVLGIKMGWMWPPVQFVIQGRGIAGLLGAGKKFTPSKQSLTSAIDGLCESFGYS